MFVTVMFRFKNLVTYYEGMYYELIANLLKFLSY